MPRALYRMAALARSLAIRESRRDHQRGCNIVKATLVGRQHPNSWSLEGVVCQELQGTWIPMEGVVKRSRSYAYGDYERSVEHLKVTELVLEPDHHALRSFLPDDIKNGTWVEINPAVGQRFNPRELTLWQEGKVIDRKGRIAMEFPR